ncbi:MAG TPA: hypothetical protein VLN48_05365 [Bryobacteraceae bacterium]|nr:hypothetical protein [Bryobacteraceae bacterium]
MTKFQFKVREFIRELSLGDQDGDSAAPHGNFRNIKEVAAFRRFVGHTPKVVCNGARGMGGLSKSIELRVAAVTLGRSSQNLLGKQRLAPQGNQPCPV